MDDKQITELAVKIVSSFIRNNRTDADEVSGMLNNVGTALRTAANPAPVSAMAEQPQRKRRIVRRRGGKVVEGAGADDSGNETSPDVETNEHTETPTASEDTSNGDEYNEHGYKIRPEPMFD